jgi:hypothetical protein
MDVLSGEWPPKVAGSASALGGIPGLRCHGMPVTAGWVCACGRGGHGRSRTCAGLRRLTLSVPISCMIASPAAVTRYIVGEEVYGWLLHDSQQSKQHAHPRWAAFRLTRTAALGAARLRAAGDPTSSPSLGRRPEIRRRRATASRRQVGNSLAVLGWGRVAGRANWINAPRRSTERWWSSSSRVGGRTVCQVVLDPTVRYEPWLQLVLGRPRSPRRPTASQWMARPPHGPCIMAHWRVQGWRHEQKQGRRRDQPGARSIRPQPL